ncbi:MAG: protein BatD [Crocinitomicaceae bacterium]|nr:protein BatD [Crocinitomicaceae bacterium]
MIRLLAILPLFIVFFGFGQKAYIETAVSSSRISSVQPLTYQIQTDCDCNIEPPDFSDFDVLDRQPGQSSYTMNINGKVTNVCTSTLTFVLRPKKKGKITIGEATAKCENENKTSEDVTVTVVDADELHKANEGVASYYFKLVSNKQSVYVGEPFTLTMYLYSEKLPENINNIVKGDALGLTRHPLYNERDPGHTFTRYEQNVKGKKYQVIELTKEVCFADHPGTIDISAYYGSAVESYSIWENKYMDGYSNSLQIKVKEVPVDKPENYYGMAGEFEITHEISKTSVVANHAIDMNVTISGTGNFHLLKTPEFNFPKDSFMVTGPEIERNLTQSEEGATGSVNYHYVITPTKAGEYLILPYSFSYFDWNDKQMKSVSTHDILLTVAKGNETFMVTNNSSNGEEATETDIRYIHTTSAEFFTDADFLFGRLYFWLGVTGPLGFFFVLLIIKRRKSKKSEEEIKAAEQKVAKRSTVKDIKKLKRLEGIEGVNELKRALEEYFMVNLDVGRSALSRNNIIQLLDKKGVNTSIIQTFGEIWDKLEMARYAPISSQNMSELYDKTEALIQDLNRQL